MVVIVNGKKYRELRNDNDNIVIKGHRIRWSKKYQRYTIYDINERRQIYDTEYYDDAVRFVVKNR